jgi:adenosylhomocysteine nucleosidase
MIYRRIGLLALALFAVSANAAPAPSLVGVLGITQEVAPIEKNLEDSREVVVQGYVFHVGTLKGRPVVVGRSGPGKVNAAIVATLLIGHFSPSALFFSGTAGALDPALRPGDVVIGETVAQHDVGLQTPDGLTRRGPRNALTGEFDPILIHAPDLLLAAARRSTEGLTLPAAKTPEGDHIPRIVEGVIVTGDVFMSDSAHREELRTTLGASAIEMEGAAFIQTCRQFGVPCLVVRSVTDRADTQALTSYQQFVGMASENAATLVTAIIGRLGSGTPQAHWP